MDESTEGAGLTKSLLRRRLTAARRSRTAPDRTAAATANAVHLAALLSGYSIVCGYLPLSSEPLSSQLLDALVDAGTTVLVPLVSADAPLDWCRYPSPTTTGAFGIAEPTGPRLGTVAMRNAEVILLPALAVDLAGHRLGRGGGHYDRTLALLPGSPARSGSPLLVAVVFDGEILDEVPVEPHDRTVTAAVTPGAGIRYFSS